MRLQAVKTITKREYLARIRTKAFWISTIALPVMMAAWSILPGLMIAKAKASQHLAVVDATGRIVGPLTEKLEEWSERTAQQVELRHRGAGDGTRP